MRCNIMAQKKLTQYDRKRRMLRDSLWGDRADELIYDRKAESGFFTLPRTMPLMLTLIAHLSKRGDPSGAYLELWARQRDDGFVEILDPDEMAVGAGFHRGTTRRVRSFHEALEEL